MYPGMLVWACYGVFVGSKGCMYEGKMSLRLIDVTSLSWLLHFHWVYHSLSGRRWSAHTFRSAFPPPSVQRSLYSVVATTRHDAIISCASTNTPPTQLLRREGLLDWQLQTSVMDLTVPVIL